MPLPQNFYAFLGAGVVGVVCAATLYVVEHFRQEKQRHGLAKDLERLDVELTTLRQELNHYVALQKEKSAKNRKRRTRNESVLSSTTTEDYESACDSDDLEFYDVSDDEETVTLDLEAILNEIDVSLDEGNQKEVEMCLERLRMLRTDNPENPQISWRIAKAHRKLLQKTDDLDVILDHISQGLEACEVGLSQKPELMETHKWTSILIGEKTEHLSLKDKLKYSMKFKFHVERAMELCPTDPVLNHMYGRFLFEYAKLKWYERKVASMMSDIPDASYEEALEHFLRAEEFSKKEWKENKMWVGKCQISVGNFEEALKWLEEADAVKTDNGLDEKVDREVKDLLQKYRS